MPNLVEADLDALSNLVTQLQRGINDLEDMDDGLKLAYSNFIASYQSSRRPWVEEEFQEIFRHIYEARRLDQSLYNSFEKLYTELYAADGNHPI